MIYIVSGFPKTGTTMMMRAAAAGGLEIAEDATRTMRQAKQYGDSNYSPHSGGEVNPPWHGKGKVVDLEAPIDPAWIYQFQGRVLKLVTQWLRALGDAPHSAVYMARDPEEIRQSYEAMLSDRLPPRFVDAYPSIVRRDLSLLYNPVVLHYRRVMEDPLTQFRRIPWDWDVEAAAAVVDPSRYRFRKELLVPGI